MTPFPVPQNNSKPAPRTQCWLVPALCLFLAAAIWLVFGQTLGHEFCNYDDDVYVYKNPAVTGGLSAPAIGWAFTHFHSANWHPLTWCSHMLDCHLYGLNPGGHHLTNVLLHTATTLLLFLLLRSWTGSLWRSAFVAAVFAIHPLRVESVAWIAERKDVLSGCFCLLTLWAYAAYARRAWSPWRYGVVLLLFTLGLLAKPMLVTLPVILLLLDFWPLPRRLTAPEEPAFHFFGRPLPRRIIRDKIPLLALALASGVVTVLAQGHAISTLPLSERLGNAIVSYVTYIGQMFYPVRLAVFYPHPENGLALWKILAALALLLVITGVAIVRRRQQPWLLTGWLWYLVMLAPAIGVLQVGAQAHADRYTYLPQIGLTILCTWLVAEATRRWASRRLLLGALAPLVLLTLMLAAHRQTAVWRNSETLWTHALACTTNNIVAHNNLGNALYQRGQVAAAIAQYQQALALKPDHAEARYNLANALVEQGKLADAIPQYQAALASKPGDPKIHYNLGIAFLKQSDLPAAINQFQQSLQLNPDDPVVRNNLGNTLFQSGETAAAITQFEAALRLQPDNTEAHYNLGYALWQAGRADDARAQFQAVLQRKPDNAETHHQLGNIFLQQSNVTAAVTEFQHAVQTRPAWAEAHYDLGVALLQQGAPATAVEQFEKAVTLKPDYADALNNLAWLLATTPQAALRNGPRAVTYAEQASRLAGGQDPDMLDTLAAAYAEAGRFEEAKQNATRALELARAAGAQAQVEQLTAELTHYTARHPYHQNED